MSKSLDDDILGPASALLCLILFVAVFFIGYFVGRQAEWEAQRDDYPKQSAAKPHLNSEAERHRTPIKYSLY
jgi:Na+-transporting methylmalonyl-CoA/oxaloacetate decarboxylase gamma subunit